MAIAKRITKKFKHAILYGDTHYPFQDDQAIAVVRSIIRDVKPDLVVDMGDLLDCYTISRFSKDPARKHDLQDEIDQGIGHLQALRQDAGKATCVLLDSNHFDRLARLVGGLSGEARELARLRTVQGALSWPTLLEIRESNWRWLPQNQQARTRLIPKMILKHGTIVRKGSAMSARAEYERYCRSGASGHTHRLGHFYHRDLDGPHGWLETGCTCDVNADYIMDGYADWQQGVTIVSYTEDGERFGVEQVVIHQGKAIYRDAIYAA